MTVTINGMTVAGTVDEIRELIANPPHVSVAKAVDDLSVTVENPKPVAAKRKCPYSADRFGCDKHSCGYCTSNVLTSIPPQYQRCVYAPDTYPQFKTCAEVALMERKGNYELR